MLDCGIQALLGSVAEFRPSQSASAWVISVSQLADFVPAPVQFPGCSAWFLPGFSVLLACGAALGWLGPFLEGSSLLDSSFVPPWFWISVQGVVWHFSSGQPLVVGPLALSWLWPGGLPWASVFLVQQPVRSGSGRCQPVLVTALVGMWCLAPGILLPALGLQLWHVVCASVGISSTVWLPGLEVHDCAVPILTWFMFMGLAVLVFCIAWLSVHSGSIWGWLFGVRGCSSTCGGSTLWSAVVPSSFVLLGADRWVGFLACSFSLHPFGFIDFPRT